MSLSADRTLDKQQALDLGGTIALGNRSADPLGTESPEEIADHRDAASGSGEAVAARSSGVSFVKVVVIAAVAVLSLFLLKRRLL